MGHPQAAIHPAPSGRRNSMLCQVQPQWVCVRIQLWPSTNIHTHNLKTSSNMHYKYLNMATKRPGTWRLIGREHGDEEAGNMAMKRPGTWRRRGREHGDEEAGNMATKRLGTWRRRGRELKTVFDESIRFIIVFASEKPPV